MSAAAAPRSRPTESPPRRVALGISHLGAGGAQRVATILANAWTARGDRVTLITIDDSAAFYPLDVRVERVSLGLARASRGPLDSVINTAVRVRALRRVLRGSRADVCVGFIDRFNILLIAATRGLDVPVVVSERVHPGFLDPRGWGVVRKLAYSKADLVVAQTEETARELESPLGPRVVTVPNPVLEQPVASERALRVVGAGRLVPQKGFDVLLRAFAIATRDQPEWSLVIYGEGAERARLEAMIGSLGLTGRAHLAGTTKRLADELARASVFALSSRFEGFPNVLCEAMAVGLPVVSTRCPAGPEEIVREGVDGHLVPVDDEREMARALARLLESESERDRMGRAAREISQRYSLARVVAQWDEAFAVATGDRSWRR